MSYVDLGERPMNWLFQFDLEKLGRLNKMIKIKEMR